MPTNDSAPSTNPSAQGPDRTYSTPVLLKYGSMRELTQSLSSTMNMNDMSAGPFKT